MRLWVRLGHYNMKSMSRKGKRAARQTEKEKLEVREKPKESREEIVLL